MIDLSGRLKDQRNRRNHYGVGKSKRKTKGQEGNEVRICAQLITSAFNREV